MQQNTRTQILVKILQERKKAGGAIQGGRGLTDEIAGKEDERPLPGRLAAPGTVPCRVPFLAFLVHQHSAPHSAGGGKSWRRGEAPWRWRSGTGPWLPTAVTLRCALEGNLSAGQSWNNGMEGADRIEVRVRSLTTDPNAGRADVSVVYGGCDSYAECNDGRACNGAKTCAYKGVCRTATPRSGCCVATALAISTRTSSARSTRLTARQRAC